MRTRSLRSEILRRARAGGLFAAALSTLVACAGPTSAPKTPAIVREPTVVISEGGTTNVLELLAQADARFDADDFAGAALLYERVVQVDSGGGERPRALLGAATAHDFAGAAEAALGAYQRLAALNAGPLRLPGAAGRTLSPLELSVRVVRLDLYLERYADAERLGRALPQRELVPRSLVVVQAAKTLGALGRGELALAEADLSAGLPAFVSLSPETLPKLPLDLAAYYFAEGELRSAQAEKLVFDPFPADFSQVLEERCRLLLLAQGAYANAMRGEDASYSARAGLAIGGLYQSLHTALVTMPRPPAANSGDRLLLLDAALRLRYEILLEKAEKMMSHTLAMIERTAQSEAFRERVAASQAALLKARDEERASIERLGFPRDELARVLRDLERDAEERAAGSQP